MRHINQVEIPRGQGLRGEPSEIAASMPLRSCSITPFKPVLKPPLEVRECLY